MGRLRNIIVRRGLLACDLRIAHLNRGRRRRRRLLHLFLVLLGEASESLCAAVRGWL